MKLIMENWNKFLEEEGGDSLRRDIFNVASYIQVWFNENALNNTGASLARYLRRGVEGFPGDPYSAQVSFTKALGEVAPENVEEFKELFMKLADGIEADPSLLNSKTLGKKGDWYGVAKSL